MYLVTRGHFRSRDEDDGHTIRSAIAENPMLHAQFMALCVTELPIEVLHCGNRDFRPLCPCDALDLDPMTFMNRIRWKCTGCANMNFLRKDFRKLSSDRHAYGQTRPK